jgi:hypothetical protein
MNTPFFLKVLPFLTQGTGIYKQLAKPALPYGSEI